LVQAFLKKWWVESDFKAPKDTGPVSYEIQFDIPDALLSLIKA
jgi:hypothetical protein